MSVPRGRNLFLRSVTNLITGVGTNPTTGAAIIQRQFGSRFAEIDYKTSGGRSHYEGLQTTLNRWFATGFSLSGQCTWAHDIGSSAGSGGGSSRNVRRPDVVAGVNPFLNQGLQMLNPAAFSMPAAGSFGDYGRNACHGPSLSQLDLTISKHFQVSERVNVEFRAEIYNILNHANFANPGNVRLSQALPAGCTCSGGVVPAALRNTIQPRPGILGSKRRRIVGSAELYRLEPDRSRPNRQIQLALRFNF